MATEILQTKCQSDKTMMDKSSTNKELDIIKTFKIAGWNIWGFIYIKLELLKLIKQSDVKKAVL
jgi:hypothetical protein